eukprot:Skav208885  [mRNA]  locus=scaffold270:323716:325989:- [translate_table: standard]
MAKLCYRHTFIDAENAPDLRRRRSWPQLSLGTASGSFCAGYVAELEGRCGLTRQPVVAQALPEERSAQLPMQGPPVQPSVEVVQAAPSHGSRGYPFLCSRPCVYFAKGICEFGDACCHCHHPVHPRYKSLDRRQRAQMKEMDTWSQCKAGADKLQYDTRESGEILALLLPFLRRSLSAAQIEAPQIIAMLEEEVGSTMAPDVDQQFRRILKHMPLTTRRDDLVVESEEKSEVATEIVSEDAEEEEQEIDEEEPKKSKKSKKNTDKKSPDSKKKKKSKKDRDWELRRC